MTNNELSDKCFISQKTEKRYIVIHGSNTRTEYSSLAGKPGSSKDIIANWNNNKEKFACPYLIDRNGTITETFDDHYWSYHLNINNSHGIYDKMSIGVLLINEGPLVKEGNSYYINKYIHHQNIYKGNIIQRKFRNFEYFADLSKPQETSLLALIKRLFIKHNILPIYHSKLDFDKKVWDKASIFTHSVVNEKVTDIPINNIFIEKIEKEFPKPTSVV